MTPEPEPTRWWLLLVPLGLLVLVALLMNTFGVVPD